MLLMKRASAFKYIYLVRTKQHRTTLHLFGRGSQNEHEHEYDQYETNERNKIQSYIDVINNIFCNAKYDFIFSQCGRYIL